MYIVKDRAYNYVLIRNSIMSENKLKIEAGILTDSQSHRLDYSIVKCAFIHA